MRLYIREEKVMLYMGYETLYKGKKTMFYIGYETLYKGRKSYALYC